VPYGPGWECLRGFAVRGSGCVEIEVPENGHLTDAGDGWNCDPPFEKRSDNCEAPN
jgi:hypothetical protein